MILLAETDLEQRILNDTELLIGLEYGKPRRGHPEGKVKFHILEIWEMLDAKPFTPEEKEILRFIALIHDSFKYKVSPKKPKTGKNHHGWFARQFALNYVENFQEKACELLEMLQWHDEPYNIYKSIHKNTQNTLIRLYRLLGRPIDDWKLFLKFLELDGSTGDKNNLSAPWFKDVLKSKKLI